MIGTLCCSQWAIFCFLLDLCAIGKKDACPKLDGKGLQRLKRLGAEQLFVLFQAAPFVADEVESTALVESEPDPFIVLYGAQAHVDQNAILFCDDLWSDARRRNTARVEGTHRELGSRFADRLGGNDPDGFPLADDAAVGKVDAVAFCANAAF